MAAGTAATMAGTTVITITAIGIAKAISDDARNRRSLGRPCRLCGRRSGSIARCFTFDLPKRSTGSTALPQRYRRLVEPSDRHLSLQRPTLVGNTNAGAFVFWNEADETGDRGSRNRQ